MSVTTPEGPENPQSAALTDEKWESGWTGGAGDYQDGERRKLTAASKPWWFGQNIF